MHWTHKGCTFFMCLALAAPCSWCGGGGVRPTLRRARVFVQVWGVCWLARCSAVASAGGSSENLVRLIKLPGFNVHRHNFIATACFWMVLMGSDW